MTDKQRRAASFIRLARGSRATNNARAAEHHANLMAIWERKQ